MAEWIYNQRTGQLRDSAGQVLRQRGYSGAPGYVNVPTAENRAFQGPIPRGDYTISNTPRDSPRVGPYAIDLTPNGHDARGRDAS